MSDQSKALRSKLCIKDKDVCRIDNGCGCLEAIDDALVPLRAEIEQLTEANRRMAKGCEEMGDEIARLKAELAWYADHDGYGPTWGTGQW
jgi:hypothetical protein